MFAVLMMFIIIEENGGEAAGIYFSCKKPDSHHVGENALFTSWSAVMYPITDGGRNKCTFCLHGCGCYLITFVIAIAKAEAFSLSASNRAH
ncbi:hypothetical protein [Bacillus atrophaeus]|uniref:hypothetical protein n=1 Tax=Bacillus atrophaeus TaxID=1452 RepID=UPI0007929017|nr:hypothetical protein [Bacillus atrophaeus]KYD04616.1 hypothetical protein B4144_1213 [Bacillus atrophaeus]